MLALEPTDDLAKPAFKDVASCTKWLSQLQLTNLNLAQGTLRAQLDELNRYPMRGKDRLQILEFLRETIHTIQGDFIKKLYGKKLPLTEDEYTTLIALCNLWQSMLHGYLRCLQARETGDSSLSSSEALLSHRCLLYSSLQIRDFLLVGCEPDAKSWQILHTIYAHIEERGLDQENIRDKFNRSGYPVSCRTLYIKTLLLHRARLLGLTRAQWNIVDRWLEVFEEAFTLERSCSMSRNDAPPLAVDLAGMRGIIAVQQATSAASMRFLPMVPLSKLIRVKTILLQQGQSPQQNKLGDELDSNDCVNLLNKLHACWCEHRAESLADEPRNAPILHMCIGLENIYAHIAHKPFKPPVSSSFADKEAQKQIEAFGRVLDQTDRHNLMELGFLVEEWLVEEDGLLHGRMLRKLNTGERLGVNQLISVHKPDTSEYKVGVITLVSTTRSGQLYIAVRYLPGRPQAVIVRGNSCGNLTTGAAAALVLPDMPKLHIPHSIIIPRFWFQTGRAVEIDQRDQKKQDASLGISVDKGFDFERVSYTLKG